MGDGDLPSVLDTRCHSVPDLLIGLSALLCTATIEK